MADSVSIDEAVGYGIDFLRGIAKYLIVIIVLNVASIILIFWLGQPERVLGLAYLVLGIIAFISTFIIGFALIIGVGYKLWVDILIRSRRKEEVIVPLAATNDISEWDDEDFEKTKRELLE